MLIKSFCEATGLPRDTVRFYVKRGLLAPAIGSKPGNRYQVFDAAQVERARLIRAAQKLGFSLRQIEQFAMDYERSGLGRDAKISLLQSRLADLDRQAMTLREVRKVLAKKLRQLQSEN
jgi:DNA-binding transcriptional MerR regulator